MINSSSIRPSSALRADIAEEIRERSAAMGAIVAPRFLTVQLRSNRSEWMEMGLGLTPMHAAIDVKRARIIEPNLPIAVIDCATEDGELVDLETLPAV
jgi:hypothetical protein